MSDSRKDKILTVNNNMVNWASKYKSENKPHHKASYKILIVDDNSFIRTLIQNVFSQIESVHVEVQMAKNGKEAVELCSEQSYSAIIMDHNMPVMKGDEAVKLIREGDLNREKDFYILTASETNENEKGFSGKHDGANAFGPKPTNKQLAEQLISDMITYKANRGREFAKDFQHSKENPEHTNKKTFINKSKGNHISVTRLGTFTTKPTQPLAEADLEHNASCCKKYCTIL